MIRFPSYRSGSRDQTTSSLLSSSLLFPTFEERNTKGCASEMKKKTIFKIIIILFDFVRQQGRVVTLCDCRVVSSGPICRYRLKTKQEKGFETGV